MFRSEGKGTAFHITLAIDGLMFGEVWRLTPFTAEQREQIIDELLKLADEAFVDRRGGAGV